MSVTKKALVITLALLLALSAALLSSCGPTGETPKESSNETEPAAEPADEHTLTVGEGENHTTLESAFDCIRGMRADGDSEACTVRIKAGQYRVADTIAIDGTLSNVIVEAYGDGEVRLIGGYRVTGWQEDTFNGVDCLSAPVENEDFSDFYVNGKRASMTRFPLDGTLEPEALEDVEDSMPGSTYLIAKEGDIPAFTNVDKWQFVGIHNWIDARTPVTSYDAGSRKLSFMVPLVFEDGECIWWLENVKETFGRPNDWYVENGRVYYVPADETVTADTIEAYIPTVSDMINAIGTPENRIENLVFRDITFSVTRGDYITNVTGTPVASDNQAWSWAPGFITFMYAENCAFENCTFMDYGINGLVFDDGCRYITVSRCTFHDGGAGCVKIRGGDDENAPDATNHNTVADCTMLHCGQRRYAATGIAIMRSGNNVIEHNEIGYLYYSGITNGWNWGNDLTPTHDNLITKNYIHHIGAGMLSDLGGIYSLGNQPGTVISGNLIHDVEARSYGGCGIYGDQGTTHLLIENNVVYDVNGYALQISMVGMGTDNLVRNNVFAASAGPLFRIWHHEKKLTTTLERNIFCSTGTDMYEVGRDHLAQKNLHASGNLFYSTASDDPTMVTVNDSTKWDLEQIQKFFGIEEGSIVADPEFVDFENRDFTLKESSPALAMGFEPIDLSDVGPRA